MRTIQSMSEAQRLALAAGAELEVKGGPRFNTARAKVVQAGATPAPLPPAPASAPEPAPVAPTFDAEAAIARLAQVITEAIRPPAPAAPPPAVVVVPSAAPEPEEPRFVGNMKMDLEVNALGLLARGSMPLGDGRVMRFDVKRDPYTQRGTSIQFKVEAA